MYIYIHIYYICVYVYIWFVCLYACILFVRQYLFYMSISSYYNYRRNVISTYDVYVFQIYIVKHIKPFYTVIVFCPLFTSYYQYSENNYYISHTELFVSEFIGSCRVHGHLCQATLYFIVLVTAFKSYILSDYLCCDDSAYIPDAL